MFITAISSFKPYIFTSPHIGYTFRSSQLCPVFLPFCLFLFLCFPFSLFLLCFNLCDVSTFSLISSLLPSSPDSAVCCMCPPL